jgi:hypothetical protein
VDITSESAKYNTEYNPRRSGLFSADVIAGAQFAEKSREPGYNQQVAAVFSQVVVMKQDAKNAKAKKVLYDRVNAGSIESSVNSSGGG